MRLRALRRAGLRAALRADLCAPTGAPRPVRPDLCAPTSAPRRAPSSTRTLPRLLPARLTQNHPSQNPPRGRGRTGACVSDLNLFPSPRGENRAQRGAGQPTAHSGGRAGVLPPPARGRERAAGTRGRERTPPGRANTRRTEKRTRRSRPAAGRAPSLRRSPPISAPSWPGRALSLPEFY